MGVTADKLPAIKSIIGSIVENCRSAEAFAAEWQKQKAVVSFAFFKLMIVYALKSTF